MPSLPHQDDSSTRSLELAEQRAQYIWDHTSAPPFALLHTESGKSTGLLDMGSILKGFYVGLPEQERAGEDVLIAKAVAALPALNGLLADVPATDYVALAGDTASALDRRIPEWVDSAGQQVQVAFDARREHRAFLPRTHEVSGILGGVALDATGDLGEVIDDGRSLVGNVVRVLQDLFGDEDKEVEGESTTEMLERMEGYGAPVDALRVVALLQSLARFTARKHTNEDQAMEAMRDRLMPVKPSLEDPDFGWRAVAGPNPMILERVRGPLPSSFGVTDKHLRRALDALGLPSSDVRAASLEGATAAGRLFLADYAILDGVPCSKQPDRDFTGQLTDDETPRQRWLPAPIGLFYRLDDGLLPVAIQLGQDPKKYAVHTPGDEVWTTVKTLYLVGDLNHHETSTHLYGAHLLLEPFAVATARQLHADHPISVLLKPHLDKVLWNNFLGKQILINPDGFMEQILAGELDAGCFELMRRERDRFEWTHIVLPKDLSARGLDSEHLPVFPFRDDGVPLWHALEGFVRAYLGLYYGDSGADELARDTELCAWLTELRTEGGLPIPEVSDLDGLTEVLTAFIFRSGPFHSAVNYSQHLVRRPRDQPGRRMGRPGAGREHPTAGLPAAHRAGGHPGRGDVHPVVHPPHHLLGLQPEALRGPAGVAPCGGTAGLSGRHRGAHRA
jgi:hypothetical protein